MSTTSNLDYNQILAVLRSKRENIEEAILTIERLARDEDPVPPPPPAWIGKASSPAKKTGRRQLTAEGRRRLAENMRKRWAAKRKSSGTAKKATKKKAAKTA